ncbi:MAG: nickel pincer cofactor biosynthesis protein LarC [Proteobacteria bacterium]|nr:nickel pincer cofactor biosynthesis protein LarC [Pseudomonadota bacterium]
MIAFFDCFSGISGDMTLGAFIDIGVPVSWLKDEISRLPLQGFGLSATDIKRNGIHAKDVIVSDLEGHGSRDYSHIKSLIEKSPFSAKIKQQSLAMFEKIAVAESEIHGCPIDHVHFHEVGGIDAIVDMVGTALCVDFLGIDEIISSRLPLGSGFVTCSHGRIPLPAPATLAILEGSAVYGSNHTHETVTPTGAAIITTLSSAFGEMPDMRIEKTGYGSGKKDTSPYPNLLRIILGKKDHSLKNRVSVIETTIDDMNPEILGFVMERLFEAGALDVCFIPVFMKKNRPGTQIQVISNEPATEKLIHIILAETTSTGARHYLAERRILERESILIETRVGKIQAKRIVQPDGSVKIVPEYDALKKIALEKKVPLKTLFDAVLKDL